MSFTMYGTDEVFSALRRQIADCFQSIDDAAGKYARLLKHCEKQRDELAGLKDPERKERIDRMKRMLSREEGQAMEEQAGTEQNVARITDELREWARRYAYFEADVMAIADRIDEQYYRTCRALDSAWSATSHEVLEQAIDELSDEWVKLPVDADGVPIRVGDTIEIEHNGRVTTVTNINYNEYGWQVYCAGGGGFDKDTRCHHVQPDSWERIIEEAMAVGFASFSDESEEDCKSELVERCRRLANA